MSLPAEQTAPPNSARKVRWIVAGLFVVLVAFIVMNLPRGYSDDLSPIGTGKAAVVLVRDKNAVQSFDLMNVLDSVRDQFGGKVLFLLTDFDTPQGREFMAANHTGRATLVLLDTRGSPVKVLSAPQTAGNLTQEITALLGEK